MDEAGPLFVKEGAFFCVGAHRPMSHSVANGCKSQPHPTSLEVNSVHLWAISMETWPVLSQPV